MRNTLLLLIAISVAGCSLAIKEGGRPVDPLTRKEYKVEKK
jgi:UPF0716 family protein affecting phage T7 exclusion